jgi:acid phosphatase
MKAPVRRTIIRHALFASALGLGAGAWAGCSSAGTSTPQGGGSTPGTTAGSSAENTGTVGMELTIPGGQPIASIVWTITGPNGASTVVQSGTTNVGNSQTVSFLVGGIPSGTGYSISLSGATTVGGVTCSGSAGFSITPRATTNVSVLLQCSATAPDSGSANVSASLFNCGTVTGISASPSEVNLGYPVALSASATGANPAALTYSWSAPSGSFDNPSAPNPNFSCGAPGPVTLTVTVGDGAVPDGGTCAPTQTTATVQVQCDTAALQNDVQNVVVIYAENRSFDGLFGNFPGAHGLSEVVDSSGNPTAAYVPQKDRDGVTVLTKLPQTWGGATAAGNATAAGDGTTIAQAQTDNMPNAPFSLETGFGVANPGTPNLTTLDTTRDMAHRFFENVMEINGGTNDMFAAWLDAGGITMGHWNYSSKALYAVAQQYVLADNFFMGAYGGSFLNHQYLICGCAPSIPASVVTNNGMSVNVLGSPNAKGVPQLAANSTSAASALTAAASLKTGNIAPLDYFGTGDGYRAVNTMQPAYEPSGNTPAASATDLRYANPAAATTVPPQTQTTIGDELTAKGVGWAWYAASWNAATADGQQASTVARTVIYTPSTPRATPDFQAHHHPFNYYAAFDPGTQGAARTAHLKDLTDLNSDITNGTLPPVAFYKPTGGQNMHPGYANIDDADAHLSSLITALKASPQWSHMVIVLTFDEYGGQWDHVAPPKGDLLGPGTRIPAIIISPFAKSGTVDHTQYDTGSILRLISHRFALPTLPGIAARDAALVHNGGVAEGDLTNALTLP